MVKGISYVTQQLIFLNSWGSACQLPDPEVPLLVVMGTGCCLESEMLFLCDTASRFSFSLSRIGLFP